MRLFLKFVHLFAVPFESKSMLRGFSSANQPVVKNLDLLARIPELRLCDIGANILDDMFSGTYNNKPCHPPDLEEIFQRSKSMGVKKIVCTAGTIDESKETLGLCRSAAFADYNLVCTAGIHPTRCSIFKTEPERILAELENVIVDGISDGKIVAFGECGLDYDRLHFCNRELQLIGFQSQLRLASQFNLPLFLHSRNTNGDFCRIISENTHNIKHGGVVHSFTGNIQEMHELVSLGFYIGVNGCSLKTEENLKVVRLIPEDLLLLETDAPWCGVKATHAGYKMMTTAFPTVKKEKFVMGNLVKDRNEPCQLIQVLEIVAAVRGVDPWSLAEVVYENSRRLFKF